MTRSACAVRLTSNEALRRWPRLARACQWVAILSAGEAGCAICDYWNGSRGSCEAVDHFGGATAVVRCAWRIRNRLPHKAKGPVRW